MSDRELLELAAKTAGIDLVWEGNEEDGLNPPWCWYRAEPPYNKRRHDGICWNPLNDDGDALRLAVKLAEPPSGDAA